MCLSSATLLTGVISLVYVKVVLAFWQVIDPHGVVEAIRPLDVARAPTRQDLSGSVALLVAVTAIGLLGLALVISRLRRHNLDIQQRTAALELEMADRLQRDTAFRDIEEKYQHVLDAAADAIISIDEHGLVREFNQAAERMFGFTKAELMGRPLTPIIPERLRSLHINGVQSYLATGQRHLPSWQNIELFGLTRDGREIPLEVAFSLLEVGDAKFLTGVLRDITERKRVQEELRLAKDAAEEANRAKSEFLANMSHELRTPLNAIIGYSEMLQEEAKDLAYEGVIPDLKKIQVASHHLLELINDVLDLSKIEAGKMELFLETFDIATLIQEVVTTISPLVAKNGNTLTVCGVEGLGMIQADLTKVRQVLFNLLSNACKFTAQGTIMLEGCREEVKGQIWFTFRVCDTGIGIAPDQLERLFQEFTQADASITRQHGGTGLGLAISRRFCQMMGGDITVESVLHQGSTFTVRLPVKSPSDQAQAGHEHPWLT